MATLSMFFGIVVIMHSEPGAPHGIPHLHARFAEYMISIDLDGEVLAGSIPPKKLALLKAWIILHHDELAADWELLLRGSKPFRIDPLR